MSTPAMRANESLLFHLPSYMARAELPMSALTLLVLGIFADNPNNTLTPDNLALDTHFPD